MTGQPVLLGINDLGDAPTFAHLAELDTIRVDRDGGVWRVWVFLPHAKNPDFDMQIAARGRSIEEAARSVADALATTPRLRELFPGHPLLAG